MTKPTSYQIAILYGLQSKPLYAGTVPLAVKESRRAAGKVAKRSRKMNRKKD